MALIGIPVAAGIAAGAGTGAAAGGAILAGAGTTGLIASAGATAALTTTGGLFAALSTGVAGLSTLELIGGGLTAASGIAAISAGQTQKKVASFQAKGVLVAAQKEELEGRRAALAALEEANEIEGKQIASIAASGITFEGTPETTLARTARTARTNIELARLGGLAGATAKQLEALGIKRVGSAAATSGLISAFTGGQNFATSLIKRRR